jgi:hypothetical protein
MTAVWVQDGVTNETPTAERVGWSERCNTTCSATAWEELNGSGRNAPLYGKKTATDIGLANDRVRTIDVPEGMNAVVHENGLNLGSGGSAYLMPGRWNADSWWQNRVSALRAYKTPDQPANLGLYGQQEAKELQNINSSDIITAYNRLTQAECQNRCDYTNECVGYVSEKAGYQNCYLVKNKAIPTYNNTGYTMAIKQPSAVTGVNKCHIFTERAKQGWSSSSGWNFDKNKWKGMSAYDKADNDREGLCTYS